jgi:surfeit locus 1 family protein
MAKAPTGSDGNDWVPSGLKVRAHVPDAKPVVKAKTVSVSVLNAIPDVQAETGPAGQVPINRLRRASDFGLEERTPLTEPEAPVEAIVPANVPPGTPPQTPPIKRGFRPMPILTVLTLICLCILGALGQWQWNKYVLKTNAPAEVVAIEPSSVAAALENPSPEYRPVTVDGLIDPRTIKISVVQEGVRGYRLFSPVVLEAGGIFVDRGFVSEEDINKAPQQSGQVSLAGVLRKGAKANRYTPDNDPAADTWYWPDLTAMADMLVIQTLSADYYVALSEVDPLQTGQLKKNPYADRGGANQVKAETHLGYALQWWGFGLALIGVYIGLHVRAGRLRFRASS